MRNSTPTQGLPRKNRNAALHKFRLSRSPRTGRVRNETEALEGLGFAKGHKRRFDPPAAKRRPSAPPAERRVVRPAAM
jgi:hypothetical protein